VDRLPARAGRLDGQVSGARHAPDGLEWLVGASVVEQRPQAAGRDVPTDLVVQEGAGVLRGRDRGCGSRRLGRSGVSASEVHAVKERPSTTTPSDVMIASRDQPIRHDPSPSTGMRKASFEARSMPVEDRHVTQLVGGRGGYRGCCSIALRAWLIASRVAGSVISPSGPTISRPMGT